MVTDLLVVVLFVASGFLVGVEFVVGKDVVALNEDVVRGADVVVE